MNKTIRNKIVIPVLALIAFLSLAISGFMMKPVMAEQTEVNSYGMTISATEATNTFVTAWSASEEATTITMEYTVGEHTGTGNAVWAGLMAKDGTQTDIVGWGGYFSGCFSTGSYKVVFNLPDVSAGEGVVSFEPTEAIEQVKAYYADGMTEEMLDKFFANRLVTKVQEICEAEGADKAVFKSVKLEAVGAAEDGAENYNYSCVFTVGESPINEATYVPSPCPRFSDVPDFPPIEYPFTSEYLPVPLLTV